MKELNGAMVPVYKMGEIAEHCDVTVFRVRSAFARGRLPQHSFEGKHVYVTQPQLELIKKAFEQSEVSDEDMRASLDEEWDNGC
ncbi:hypothetical protein ACRXCV_00040 (plasmid) [Halobacteriovorax sp. GFR7]|uniref:hypothetical protein n=1 Tax=unclassified Halobacteriovorax TaxID=2639665 RepID=UPI003D976089